MRRLEWAGCLRLATIEERCGPHDSRTLHMWPGSHNREARLAPYSFQGWLRLTPYDDTIQAINACLAWRSPERLRRVRLVQFCPAMTHYAIQTQELTREYSTVRALDRLSLEIPAGSIFGLKSPMRKLTAQHLLRPAPVARHRDRTADDTPPGW